MAPISKSLALAGAFFALSGFAAPVEKRAVVWETVTSVVWTTVEVTTTVYPDQPATTPAAAVTTPAVATTTPPVVQSEPTPSVAAQTLQLVQKQEEPVVPPVISTTQPAQAPAPEPTEQSSSWVAPEPSSEPVAEPSTTFTPAPVQTVAPVSAPAAPAAGGGGNGGSGSSSGPCPANSPCTGSATFYDTATSMTNPSSCGKTNNGEIDLVLALPVGIMKDNDCGKQVVVSFKGSTETATVVDKCMGCDNTALDLSRALFKKLAPLDKGNLEGVKWHFQ